MKAKDFTEPLIFLVVMVIIYLSSIVFGGVNSDAYQHQTTRSTDATIESINLCDSHGGIIDSRKLPLDARRAGGEGQNNVFKDKVVIVSACKDGIVLSTIMK